MPMQWFIGGRGPGQKNKNYIYLVSFDMCSVHVLYVPTHVRNPVQTSTALSRFVAKRLRCIIAAVLLSKIGCCGTNIVYCVIVDYFKLL